MESYKLRWIYPLVFTILSAILFYYSQKFAGIMLTIVGLCLLWVATLSLGKSFALMPKADRLVMAGIYSKIRHPVYVGLSLISLGWLILIPDLLMAVFAFLIITSSIIRACLEEKVLIKKFGKRYLRYKKKTLL